MAAITDAAATAVLLALQQLLCECALQRQLLLHALQGCEVGLQLHVRGGGAERGVAWKLLLHALLLRLSGS